GSRNTENRGKIQRYKCNKCGYRFTVNDGFFRMRNSPQKISLCLDMYFRGVSLRKIQEHLKAFYPHNSSHEAIHSWVDRYPLMIGEFTDNLKINSGSEIEVDEMEYKTKGCQSWFIDSIDTKTRFMVASGFSKSRGKDEIRDVIKEIKRKTGKNVRVITTDGYHAYRNIINKTYGYNLSKMNYNIMHKTKNASRGEGFNHKIERLHNNIRERTKVFRGFKSIKSAKSIMKGYEIFYNFIRRHQAINCCPYELATDLKLVERNKWLELIRLSMRKK
ncbi:MAG: DDE-type integrase/transposase/recombinase, partial [Candidatus Micrarchaeota archaeon]